MRAQDEHQLTRDQARSARLELGARLRRRRPEIEQATLTRVYAVTGAVERTNPSYAQGLRDAVAAAVELALVALEDRPRRSLPVPAALLEQARRAGIEGIGLDTVLRRYFAGYTLLGDYVIEEAEKTGLFGKAELQSLLRDQAAVFDRVVAAVSAEHNRARSERHVGIEAGRIGMVERLLDGELMDLSQIPYPFEGHHLGLIAAGKNPSVAIEAIAKRLGMRHLLVRHAEGTVWAWFGARLSPDSSEVERALRQASPPVCASLGEVGENLSGWRMTHRQASAALPIAIERGLPCLRYGEVAVLASMLADDLLMASLRKIYLDPLATARDGGESARQTLRTYFRKEQNVSSTAAALGVNRQTIAKRLRAVEDRLGRSLNSCSLELRAALMLDDPAPPE